jgi:hypothetical protein
MIGEGSRGRTGLMTRLRGARADAAHGSGQWGCAAWVCRGAWAGWLARSVSCTIYTQYIYIELRSICVVSTETPHPPTWVDLPTVQTFLQIGPTSGDGAPSRTPDGKQLHPGHMCPQQTNRDHTRVILDHTIVTLGGGDFQGSQR